MRARITRGGVIGVFSPVERVLVRVFLELVFKFERERLTEAVGRLREATRDLLARAFTAIASSPRSVRRWLAQVVPSGSASC